MTAPHGAGVTGSSAPASGGSGLPDHVAGTLCYVLGAITGILFFLLDRHRPFVRFHALQAIGLTIAWIALSVALVVFGLVTSAIPVVGWLVDVLITLGISLAGFALWIWLMVQAWRGNQWEFPFVGHQVRRIASRMDTTPAAPRPSA